MLIILGWIYACLGLGFGVLATLKYFKTKAEVPLAEGLAVICLATAILSFWIAAIPH